MGEVLGLALTGRGGGNLRGGRMDYGMGEYECSTGTVLVSYRSCPMGRKGRKGRKGKERNRREGGEYRNSSIGGHNLWNEEGGFAVQVLYLYRSHDMTWR